MTLQGVVSWGTSIDDDLFIVTRDDQGRNCRLHMTREAALQMALAIQRAVSELSAPVPADEKRVIQVARCLQLVSTKNRLALVLETADGLELPLALDQAAIDSLSCCIRRELPSIAH